jgi:segregation and condensation protein A
VAETARRAAEPDLWEAEAPPRQPHDEHTLVIDVGGFEGPLDLLLALARSQKVDLSRISILALAEQYIAYIESARGLRLELAADYLVMAAWLAFLKSRLLLPDPPAPDEPTGEEMAELLAFRLRRLEAIREVAGRLAARSRLGRDVFARGAPEPVVTETERRYDTSLYDLLSAYAAERQRGIVTVHHVAKRQVWSLAEARAVLTRMIGSMAEWTPMEAFLSPWLVTPEQRRTVLASALGASLELAREGKLAIRQTAAFAPIHLRDCAGPPPRG